LHGWLAAVSLRERVEPLDVLENIAQAVVRLAGEEPPTAGHREFLAEVHDGSGEVGEQLLLEAEVQ